MTLQNPIAEQDLWQSVVVRAVRDAVVNSPKPTATELHDQHSAQVWLASNSSDFRHVCELAGFEPDVVREWWLRCKEDRGALDRLEQKLREGRRV